MWTNFPRVDMDRSDVHVQRIGIREPLSGSVETFQATRSGRWQREEHPVAQCAKRYFYFYNTPGSALSRQLVTELQNPIDKGKYKMRTMTLPRGNARIAAFLYRRMFRHGRTVRRCGVMGSGFSDF